MIAFRRGQVLNPGPPEYEAGALTLDHDVRSRSVMKYSITKYNIDVNTNYISMIHL
jgi:hypothetical protein